MACTTSDFDGALSYALQRLGTPDLEPKPEQIAVNLQGKRRIHMATYQFWQDKRSVHAMRRINTDILCCGTASSE